MRRIKGFDPSPPEADWCQVNPGPDVTRRGGIKPCVCVARSEVSMLRISTSLASLANKSHAANCLFQALASFELRDFGRSNLDFFCWFLRIHPGPRRPSGN